MKKLFLSLTLVAMCAIAAMAQPYTSVVINNNTTCDVYVKLDGDVSGSPCTTDYQSPFIPISPGITNFSDPSVVPNGMYKGTTQLGSTGLFTAIEVASSNPIVTNLCATINAFYMSDCSAFRLVSATSTFDDWDGITCTPCGGGNTYNIDLTVIGSTLQLDIN